VGVQRSEDGGQSWQMSLDVEAGAIVGARSAQNRVYLSTADAAIYRSDDAVHLAVARRAAALFQPDTIDCRC